MCDYEEIPKKEQQMLKGEEHIRCKMLTATRSQKVECSTGENGSRYFLHTIRVKKVSWLSKLNTKKLSQLLF